MVSKHIWEAVDCTVQYVDTTIIMKKMQKALNNNSSKNKNPIHPKQADISRDKFHWCRNDDNNRVSGGGCGRVLQKSFCKNLFD